jgi:hypothetical protein
MGAGFNAVGGKGRVRSVRHRMLSFTTPHHLPNTLESLSITPLLLQYLVINGIFTDDGRDKHSSGYLTFKSSNLLELLGLCSNLFVTSCNFR